MAKDPAYLFYPAEASEDTQFMNRLERGAYFDIMKCQRLFHGITTVQMKKILGKDYDEVWPSLELVLKHDETGYFIGWVRDSLGKRTAFREKQKERINKRWEEYRGNSVVLPVGNGNNILSNNDNKKKNGVPFFKPTLEEVKAYCKERGKNVDAAKWYNFYEAKGWMIGKNKMKDWMAAVRTWEPDATEESFTARKLREIAELNK